MENKTDFELLLDKYLAGKASAAERALLENWYHVKANAQLDEEHFGMDSVDEVEMNEAKILIWNGIDFTKKDVVTVSKFTPVRKLWPRVVAAAAVVLVLSIGFYFYDRKGNHPIQAGSVYANDIDPGSSGATLTLADGTKIRLADAASGEIAKQSGVMISKTADGELIYELKGSSSEQKINTIATGNGERYRLKLPDGSLVWLNSGSSLTYAASLVQDGKRLVELQGEGYFEIAKDKLRPFIVQTADQQVEVLGTHFNINSYRDEPLIATTLLEGSVRVSAGNRVKMIAPGEQLRNHKGQLIVSKVNAENITDWKDGEFNLEGLDFRTAMRKIARWYDVEVIYDKSVPEAIEAGGWIPMDSKLSSILKLIENAGQVKFRVEGKKVYVYK